MYFDDTNLLQLALDDHVDLSRSLSILGLHGLEHQLISEDPGVDQLGDPTELVVVVLVWE